MKDFWKDNGQFILDIISSLIIAGVVRYVYRDTSYETREILTLIAFFGSMITFSLRNVLPTLSTLCKLQETERNKKQH